MRFPSTSNRGRLVLEVDLYCLKPGFSIVWRSKIRYYVLNFLEASFLWCLFFNKLVKFILKIVISLLIIKRLAVSCWGKLITDSLQIIFSWDFNVNYTDRRMYTYSRISVRRFGYFHHLPKRILKQMIHHWKALIKSC